MGNGTQHFKYKDHSHCQFLTIDIKCWVFLIVQQVIPVYQRT